MANMDQIIAVGSNCSAFDYDNNSQLTSSLEDGRRSCEQCRHWTETGKCNIDVFDKVLTGLDQT
jgi:hypothetical protein